MRLQDCENEDMPNPGKRKHPCIFFRAAPLWLGAAWRGPNCPNEPLRGTGRLERSIGRVSGREFGQAVAYVGTNDSALSGGCLGNRCARPRPVVPPAAAEHICSSRSASQSQSRSRLNNAGVYKFAPLEAVTEEEFHRQFNTNSWDSFWPRRRR